MKIFITGVTGLLGGELLVRLSKQKEVEKIYCLVRSANEYEALHRLGKIFNVHEDLFDQNKVVPVIGDLLQENLTDVLLSHKELRDVKVIIHSAANTCFSRIYDKIVEATNMDGLVKVLKWAQRLENLQTFLYIGTATSCGKDASNRIILENESPNEKANHLVRYTYTKMMGELLLRQYLPEEKVLVVRPSIITGDSRDVRPRSPIILWAIATINQLRLIPVNGESTLDMVPVDFVAEAIILLLRSKRQHNVYHVSSGRQGATSPLQLSRLLEAHFEDMPPFRFVEKPFLNQTKLWSKRALKPESELYQYQSYLGYWEEIFEDRKQLRVLLAGLEPYLDFIELGQIFDNTRLLQDTGMSQPVPAHDYLIHSIPYMKEINLLAGAVDA